MYVAKFVRMEREKKKIYIYIYMLATEHSYDTVNDNRIIVHNSVIIIERANIRVNTYKTIDAIYSRVHLFEQTRTVTIMVSIVFVDKEIERERER